VKFKSNKDILNNFLLYTDMGGFKINFNNVYEHIFYFNTNKYYNFLLLDSIDYLLYIKYRESVKQYSLYNERSILLSKFRLSVFYEEILKINIVSLNNKILKL